MSTLNAKQMAMARRETTLTAVVTKTAATLRVLVMDDAPHRHEAMQSELSTAGFEVVATLRSTSGLLDSVRGLDPDVVIVGVACLGARMLEHLRQLSADHPRPVLLFVERSDAATTCQAVAAGVSAYVVNGFRPDRLCTLMDLAVARFEQGATLRRQLRQANDLLARRKIIDRAKGVVMARGKLTENEAYHALRKQAMDRNQTIAQVAENLIASAELLA